MSNSAQRRWSRRKRLSFNETTGVQERCGPTEHILTLNNGDEIIVRRQVTNGRTDGCHVVWPKVWMPSRPMGNGGRMEWWAGMRVKETKRSIEHRLDYMRGV